MDKTLVEKKHKHRTLKEEIVDNDIILYIVDEIETLVSEARTTNDLKKDFPDRIEKLAKTLNNFLSEIGHRLLKSEFLDK